MQTVRGFCVVLCLICPGCGAKDDLTKIQGEWRQTGKPWMVGHGTILRFAGNKFFTPADDKSGEFTLNEKTSLRQINLGEVQGIYELNGDTLHIEYGLVDRPKEMSERAVEYRRVR